MNKVLIEFLKIVSFVFFISSLPAAAQNVDKIMEKVDLNARGFTDSVASLIKISTCKFSVQNKKLKCNEKPQIKLIETISINLGKQKKDSKSLAFIYEPPSERGVGMLMYNYNSTDRDNETWLYLSALGKVKRIVSSNSDSLTEPASIFGSEFTTEDRESGKLDDYQYKLLGNKTYKGSSVVLIEQLPNKEKALKSRYAKTVLWVDASRDVVLKAKMFNREGKEIRRIISGNLDIINNIWIARTSTILNLQTKRLSKMIISKVKFDIPIKQDFFSTRALIDKAFRQKGLDAIRTLSDQ